MYARITLYPNVISVRLAMLIKTFPVTDENRDAMLQLVKRWLQNAGYQVVVK